VIRTALHAAAAQNPVNGLALLGLARDLAIAAQQSETTVLLTIDQAEELFGYSPPESAALSAALAGRARSGGSAADGDGHPAAALRALWRRWPLDRG
jgi:hypothetical protein